MKTSDAISSAWLGVRAEAAASGGGTALIVLNCSLENFY
jgi:hypothetical protein